MFEFHNDEKHDKHFALLFDSCNIEYKFKERASNIPYTIIKDREEKRISAMLTSAGAIGAQFIHLQTSAISCIALAKSDDEAMLMSLGFLKIVPQGMAICPTCLDQSILTCEENLAVLKDIREATKKYATNS